MNVLCIELQSSGESRVFSALTRPESSTADNNLLCPYYSLCNLSVLNSDSPLQALQEPKIRKKQLKWEFLYFDARLISPHHLILTAEQTPLRTRFLASVQTETEVWEGKVFNKDKKENGLNQEHFRFHHNKGQHSHSCLYLPILD